MSRRFCQTNLGSVVHSSIASVIFQLLRFATSVQYSVPHKSPSKDIWRGNVSGHWWERCPSHPIQQSEKWFEGITHNSQWWMPGSCNSEWCCILWKFPCLPVGPWLDKLLNALILVVWQNRYATLDDKVRQWHPASIQLLVFLSDTAILLVHLQLRFEVELM